MTRHEEFNEVRFVVLLMALNGEQMDMLMRVDHGSGLEVWRLFVERPREAQTGTKYFEG